jgi:hypothetical protein
MGGGEGGGGVVAGQDVQGGDVDPLIAAADRAFTPCG